jgi:cytochrome c oxidase cbb3-type subunit III
MRYALCALALVAGLVDHCAAIAQSWINSPGGAAPVKPSQPDIENKFMRVPQVNNIPGGVAPRDQIKNPVADDPAAVERGRRYFTSLNCVGCHAPNGGGGMGPALSTREFKFGAESAQHFMVITRGGPLGMPAWAEVLPASVIWDLVSYIDSISNAPSDQWGTTFSPTANLPRIEQVPAEFNPTAKPWQATQPFSGGQAPQK